MLIIKQLQILGVICFYTITEQGFKNQDYLLSMYEVFEACLSDKER